MISFPLFVLVLCTFVAIGLLPVLFFRRDGQINLRWLVTAAPFFVVPAVLLLGQFGRLEPQHIGGQAVSMVVQAAAVILCCLSVALIAMTVGTHRVPLALWHQENDAPLRLVTRGPYARIRHPFYTSFLLAFTAAVLAFPHAVTAASLVYGVGALTITAIGEERRLVASRFGDEYRRYIAVTGRFFPRVVS